MCLLPMDKGRRQSSAVRDSFCFSWFINSDPAPIAMLCSSTQSMYYIDFLDSLSAIAEGYKYVDTFVYFIFEIEL